MKAMLGVVVILTGVALIYALSSIDEFSKTFKDVSDKCMTTTKMSVEQLAQLNFSNTTATKETYCWIACTAKGFGIMTADNKINKEKALEMFNTLKGNFPEVADKVKSIVDKCLAEVTGGGSDECAVAKSAYECATKYVEKEGLLKM